MPAKRNFLSFNLKCYATLYIANILLIVNDEWHKHKLFECIKVFKSESFPSIQDQRLNNFH